jgi:hypothetical protein
MRWGSVRQRGDLDSALTPQLASWLADDFIENYVSWREEAAGVQSAYVHWQAAQEPDESLAFAAYRAALDREELAAGMLRESAERVSATQS